MGDFIAIDVETANADLSSICAIGLVHFRDGRVFNNLSTLVNPKTEFSPVNVAIHKILPEHVRDAPTMAELYPLFLEKFRDVVLAHHTHFDKSAFMRVAEDLGAPEMQCAWLDTARVCRIAWPRYSKRGYGLASVCYDFRIDFRHHDAAEDARAAGLVLCRAIAETGVPLGQWLEKVRAPIRAVEAAAGPQPGEPNPDGPLFGHTICFTGSLSIPREVAQRLAAAAGCIVKKTVNSRTTIVVVGDDEFSRTADNRSIKHAAARKYIAAGYEMRIVCERDFMLMAGA